MKNSVKDRTNAASSCAANFVAEHLNKDYRGGWLHIDIAGPAWINDRGTGYGVALVLELLMLQQRQQQQRRGDGEPPAARM
jgi:probable aminopeptidase NPEPL1